MLSTYADTFLSIGGVGLAALTSVKKDILTMADAENDNSLCKVINFIILKKAECFKKSETLTFLQNCFVILV
jgi:hypothetical protein